MFGTNRQRARLTRVIPVDARDPHGEQVGQSRATSSTGVPSEHPPLHRKSAPAPSPEECSDSATGESNQPDACVMAENDLTSLIGTEGEKALDLFRLFCTRGRDAHAWRKNDLRLINSCVVPLLYGSEVQLDI